MSRCAECIIRDVANEFGVTPVQLRLPDKRRPVSYARFAAYRFLRDEAKLGVTQIGRIMGYRDHSSVCEGLKKANALLKENADFAAAYEKARQG